VLLLVLLLYIYGKTLFIVLTCQYTFVTGGMDSKFCKRLCMEKKVYTS